MNVIRRMLGIAPTAEKDGRGYIPSPLGLFLGVDKKSGYQPTDFGGRKYVGDKFDVVTPTGAPAILEQWSVPTKDKAVLAFLKAHQARFDHPVSLADLVARGALNEGAPYVALFLPGGHGAMVGLPDPKNVGTLIRWVRDTDRYLVAVCHGPAALMATTKNGEGPHPYAGYALCAFPDSVDRQMTAVGPGSWSS